MNGTIMRVRYYDDQYLRKAEFVDEQAYHVAMRRRHQTAHHTWGIVYGLEIEKKEGENAGYFVNPGVAVDGYGRMLILPVPTPIEAAGEFDRTNRNRLDTYLIYNVQPQRAIPVGFATQADRWFEIPDIIFTGAETPPIDRRDPSLQNKLVALDHTPSESPPDDPTSVWYVFLGQIERKWIGPEHDKFEYLAPNLADRPYVGLVGATVEAPSKRAKVQIGGAADNEGGAFAVYIGDSSGATVEAPSKRAKVQIGGAADNEDSRGATKQSTPKPALKVDGDGKIELNGPTTVTGNLAIQNGALQFSGTSIPVSAAWHLYRCTPPADTGSEETEPAVAGKGQGKSVDPPAQPQQLRVEMGQNKGDAIVIGAWSEDAGAFRPCMTVSRDGDEGLVQIHGNLVVNGYIDGKIIETGNP